MFPDCSLTPWIMAYSALSLEKAYAFVPYDLTKGGSVGTENGPRIRVKRVFGSSVKKRWCKQRELHPEGEMWEITLIGFNDTRP